MSLVKLIELPFLGDERGALVSVEANNDVPFEVKRIYYIYKTEKGISRGYHAHRSLQQLAICVAGQCRISLDDGTAKESVWLRNPSQGLLIGNNIWREMHDFSDDCVLLVLASEYYDENDYIRNYQLFLEETKNVKR